MNWVWAGLYVSPFRVILLRRLADLFRVCVAGARKLGWWTGPSTESPFDVVSTVACISDALATFGIRRTSCCGFYNPSLHPFSTTATETFIVFTMATAGPLAHLKRTCHWTALRATGFADSLCEHWRLSWTGINRLEFTAEDLDTVSSLWTNFNLSMHLEGWANITHQEEGQVDCTRWDWTYWPDHTRVNVKMTGLPISSDEVIVAVTGCNWDWIWHCDLGCWMHCLWTLLCWLMHWSLGSRFPEDKIAPLAHSAMFAEHCSCSLQIVLCLSLISQV